MFEQILANQQLGSLGPTNFLKYAIHWLVWQGVSPELVVLILLLPLMVTLITIARYFVGIQGLGIFTPVMLGVVFLSTGIGPGIFLFLAVLLIEILVIFLLRKIKIHFMAKMALVLLIVCLGFFPLLLLSLKFNPPSLFNSSLIPILILILIGENLAEVQLRKTPKKAIRATVETLILASLAFFVLNSAGLRKMTLLYPEAMIILIAILDIWMGQFTGLRLLEYRRFRKLLKK